MVTFRRPQFNRADIAAGKAHACGEFALRESPLFP